MELIICHLRHHVLNTCLDHDTDSFFVHVKYTVNVETFLLPTDAHNVKKHRVIKTF